MKEKEITVAFYLCSFTRKDWRYELDERRLERFFHDLNEEFSRFDIRVSCVRDDAVTLDVKGYADLLNSIRLRSVRDSIYNLCLGHVIGQSQHLDLFEDIRRGVNRVAFAPETIEPEGSNKVVCHNCGCGC